MGNEASRRTNRTLLVCLAVAVMSLGANVASAQVARDPSRLRLGIEGGFGGDWGTPRGPSLGLFGQLGVQFNRTFALYYQPSAYVHALGTSNDADVFGAYGHLAMADVTVGPLQLGGGLGFDVGRFADCSGNTCRNGELDIHRAFGGRVALVLSLPALRGRIGIPFALQVHSTRLSDEDRLTSLLLTVGIQRF